jgi:branched-subunit amino acid aminotransferase/4-amino-4-deoxychorismate lyase
MLIWFDRRIVAGDGASIPVADRTFEHGLGLFETLRTWDGRPTLLDRHLARLTRSADELGLPLDPGSLPDAGAVAELRRANGADGDVLVRITLSGGVPDGRGGSVWMRTAPLPTPPPPGGAVVAPAPWTISPDDPLARYKTLNYWSRRRAHDRGRSAGADEVLFATPDGRVWEGSRTNLFLVRGTSLVTPGLDGPVLPGVMRALVLELAGGVGLSPRERDVSAADLDGADEVFLTNSVRGIVPVGRTPTRTFEAPGGWTRRLSDRLGLWLRESGSTDTDRSPSSE